MNDRSRLLAELDALVSEAKHGDARDAYHRLARCLNRARGSLDRAEWTTVITEVCRPHPLWALMQQEPLTARAYAKPRGYAGDAEMLDYMYFGPPADLDELSRRLCEAAVAMASCESVRRRRDLLAKEIDAVAEERPGARILAVACGHLREAPLSRAIANGRVAELVALDQDPLSIARVDQECAQPVRPLLASVGDLLRGDVDEGSFDLIYASGLYDYLTDDIALRLSSALLAMLRPGGRLLIGNFTPDSHGRGYMEAFMDWYLVYRSEDDLRRLAHELGRADAEVFSDELDNVAYLRVA